MHRILAITICVLLSGGCYEYARQVAELQKLLDSAVEDDAAIVLKLGDDFTSAPGTVIFLSRREGREKMIELARRGEDELAMLYLPEWGAWITQTTDRQPGEAQMDMKFILAALASGTEVEDWHTHNNVEPKYLAPKELEKRGLQSTMPSTKDLRQYHYLSALHQGAKFSGVIASIHGTLKYWNDNPEWTVPRYVAFAITQDGHRLYLKVAEITPQDLPEFARTFEGEVKLLFER